MAFASEILSLLRGVGRAAKPAMSAEQHALINALGDFRSSGVPEVLHQPLAAEAALRDFTQPMDRRGFFRNIVGLPERARQIEATRLTGQFPDNMYGMSVEDLAELSGQPDALRLVDLNKRLGLSDHMQEMYRLDDAGNDAHPEFFAAHDALQERLPALLEALKPVEPESTESFISPFLKRFKR